MELDENNREHEARAVQLRDMLLQQLERNNSSSDDVFLRETAQQFRVRECYDREVSAWMFSCRRCMVITR